MGVTLDSLGLALLDGCVSVAAIVGVIALAMIGTEQPARRVLLARGAILAALAVLPLAHLAGVPRIPLASPVLDLVDPYRNGGPQPAAPAFFRSARPILRPFVAASMAGTIAGLGWLLLGCWGCARLLQRTIEPSPESLALYAALPFHGPAPRPRLRVAATLGRPVLLGPIRPAIVIPTDLDQPGREPALHLALVHELAHAERLDPLFALLGSLAQAAWFFVPPLWWVRRQMRLDQEFLADRVASRHYWPAHSYASSLVRIAEGLPAMDSPGVASSCVTPSPTSTLFQRILMLVRSPFPVETRPPRWWSLTAILAMATGTVAASGLTLRGHGGRPPPAHCHDGGVHGQIHFRKIAPEADPAGGGPAPAFELLDTLPARFEMEGDIWADPVDLPRITIAGRRLGPPAPHADVPPQVETYHRLRMVRDDRGISLWIDRQPIPPQPEDRPPPRSLEVLPAPSRAIRFRDLKITW